MLVTCSKGTYIRTLCKDIGEKLGCGAHMSALLRTASGRFTLDNSIRLDEFKSIAAEGRLGEVLLLPEEALDGYERVVVANAAQKYLDNGNKISLSFCNKAPKQGTNVVVFNENNEIVGVYLVTEGFLKPVTMLR